MSSPLPLIPPRKRSFLTPNKLDPENLTKSPSSAVNIASPSKFDIISANSPLKFLNSPNCQKTSPKNDKKSVAESPSNQLINSSTKSNNNSLLGGQTPISPIPQEDKLDDSEVFFVPTPLHQKNKSLLVDMTKRFSSPNSNIKKSPRVMRRYDGITVDFTSKGLSPINPPGMPSTPELMKNVDDQLSRKNFLLNDPTILAMTFADPSVPHPGKRKGLLYEKIKNSHPNAVDSSPSQFSLSISPSSEDSSLSGRKITNKLKFFGKHVDPTKMRNLKFPKKKKLILKPKVSDTPISSPRRRRRILQQTPLPDQIASPRRRRRRIDSNISNIVDEEKKEETNIPVSPSIQVSSPSTPPKSNLKSPISPRHLSPDFSAKKIRRKRVVVQEKKEQVDSSVSDVSTNADDEKSVDVSEISEKSDIPSFISYSSTPEKKSKSKKRKRDSEVEDEDSSFDPSDISSITNSPGSKKRRAKRTIASETDEENVSKASEVEESFASPTPKRRRRLTRNISNVNEVSASAIATPTQIVSPRRRRRTFQNNSELQEEK